MASNWHLKERKKDRKWAPTIIGQFLVKNFTYLANQSEQLTVSMILMHICMSVACKRSPVNLQKQSILPVIFCSIRLRLALDGFDQYFKPLPNVVSSALDNFRQHQNRELKEFWECGELNPRPLGQRHECHHCATQPLLKCHIEVHFSFLEAG